MPERADTRAAIVEAASRLLRDQGPAAVTTRAVAEAAGVQAPAIYRLFGDKDGLLEAVAEHVLAEFVATKAAAVRAAVVGDTDPVDDLRTGWHQQIEFGLAHPAVFALLHHADRAAGSPAARSGWQLLTARVHRIAAAGRLRVGEQRAAELVHAAGTGVVQTLTGTPPERRDPGLADAMFEAVLGRVLTDAPAPAPDRVLAATVGFAAVVPLLDALSEAERRLLTDWLDRAVEARQTPRRRDVRADPAG